MAGEGKRWKIIEEMKESEVVFLNQMSTIQEIFINPCITEEICTTKEAALLQRLPITSITTCSQQIIEQLTHVLEQRTLSNSVGKIFSQAMTEEIIGAFCCYSSLYTKVDNWLTKLQQHEKQTGETHKYLAFMRQQQISCKTLKFENLLVTGVQRVPRYSLLLRDLLKKTPKKHADYTEIQRAKEIVDGANNRIDEQIGSFVDLLKLKAFFARFKNRDREAMSYYYGLNRKPLGSVMVVDENYNEHELFVLDDALICTLQKKDNELSFVWGGFLPQATIKDDPEKELYFEITVRTCTRAFPYATFETHHVFMDSEETEKKLKDLMGSAIAEIKNNIYFENYDSALKELAYVNDYEMRCDIY